MLNEFKQFVMRGNVMDLAIGVIIGAAFGKIVDSLVKDVIMPPIGLLMGGVDMTNAFTVLKEGKTPGPYSSLKAATDAGANVLAYGNFVNTVFQFLILAFVIFMMVKALNRMKIMREAEPAATPPDVLLLEEIRDLLKAKG
ncbi:MAG: large conductance mechanosensitive channel protein MscL [Armatimonadetes bacterium]|nr:large conductance mechanosensitive channel protein MscL [Armatimonadota bacterium]